ncbi:MAG TPA: WYL domain-containing protein, partial [Polyangia bacterium]
GDWATQSRLLPFAETLAGALDKVRGALSASAQRELIELMKGIAFVGVPAPPTPAEVRRAIEQAWFERQPVRITYRGADEITTVRTVRIASVVMERTVTLLNCDDLDKGERRQFRLDRITAAALT